MTEPFVFLRTVVPMVVTICCVIALVVLRERIKPPERGFLLAWWGIVAVIFLEGAVVALLLRLAETRALATRNAGVNALLGIGALALLALSVVLARWVRVAGQPMLGVVFRPPPGFTHRLLRGWAFISMAALFLAIGFGAFTGTYALAIWLLSSR